MPVGEIEILFRRDKDGNWIYITISKENKVQVTNSVSPADGRAMVEIRKNNISRYRRFNLLHRSVGLFDLFIFEKI